MQIAPALRPYLLLPVVAAALYTGWVFLSRTYASRRWIARQEQAQTASPASREFDRVYGGSDLKILQFYAREGTLTEGGQSVICYGVLNAKSVSISPPVEGVFPALNRCVAVTPKQDTRYTLTAQDAQGHSVSESFVLSVHPDAATLPRIASFRIAGSQKDYRGRTVVLLSFAVQNAETVDIEPKAFPTLHGAPSGRFYVSPEKTTTYTLTVTGKHGHQAKQQLTVEVPQR